MAAEFKLYNNEYFKSHGVNIMAFSDFYPAGHQSGVGLIMNGHRIATNGDVRFEPTPGQWQPVPKQETRRVDEAEQSIETELSYPNKDVHMSGFNPMIYPDLEMKYKVRVKAIEGGVRVCVDLDKELPEKYVGKVCFNLELFPGIMFGEPWLMDDATGVFPRQPNGPTKELETNYMNTFATPTKEDAKASRELLVNGGYDKNRYNPIIADDIVAEPYACGHTFVACPQDIRKRFKVVSAKQEIKLYDGRMNHNNGWFVISSTLEGGKTEGALVWDILPSVDETWVYAPVIQVSQVGYNPKQAKRAVIEMDADYYEKFIGEEVILSKMGADGIEVVSCKKAEDWGKFLRYHYAIFDFSDVREPGMYQVSLMNYKSAVFKIDAGVYDRGVWQPVMEYFMPVQMCHMRVQEKYRVWHGLCHSDDAIMAPVDINHFDGYSQGKSTLTKYKPGDYVPGLNRGGWHDAGDFDLRVESQSGEVYNLALAIEEFNAYCDSATIDQDRQVVEIHQPDGFNDILEQLEHGLLTVVGGYKALGRLYRGIIAPTLRQYVLLGDAANMTAGAKSLGDASVDSGQLPRWVFTENNPLRELDVASHLAAGARAIKEFRPELAKETLEVAKALYEDAGIIKNENGEIIENAADMSFFEGVNESNSRIKASVELYIATGDRKYIDRLVAMKETVLKNIDRIAWSVSKVWNVIEDENFKKEVYSALEELSERVKVMSKETPYGIPYKPVIWGAGWTIQKRGVEAYFLHKAFPELFDANQVLHSLNFVLGTHPGSNTASFASGVGAKSATVAYGMNRADWSYIPGGVVSGTALIQPDFPELLEFPFLWQQAEYVMGGGSTDYMLLVLAAKKLCEEMN